MIETYNDSGICAVADAEGDAPRRSIDVYLPIFLVNRLASWDIAEPNELLQSESCGRLFSSQ
ncbi:hypothetical protein GGP73_003066 [Salinibacter ruber]|nr:hypothetical protein [Salinibacter ruber]